MPLGFSFQPGADSGPGGMQDHMVGPASGGSNPQQAVKVLSLRVPKTLPSNAPVSTALLNGQGSAAPGAQGLTSLVQALMQVFQPHAPQGAPGMPSPGGPQAPTSAPQFPSGAPQPTGPEFQGNYDTPPMQNAPVFEGSPDGPDPFAQFGDMAQVYRNLGPSFSQGNSGNLNGFSMMDVGQSASTPSPRFIWGENNPGGPPTGGAAGFNFQT